MLSFRENARIIYLTFIVGKLRGNKVVRSPVEEKVFLLDSFGND
jgi:hypothetical protein